jgi:hypothetical protein
VVDPKHQVLRINRADATAVISRHSGAGNPPTSTLGASRSR